MASAETKGTLDSCLTLLNSSTAHPEQFLSLQDSLAADLTSITKTLYDFHKAQKPVGIRGSPLEQLVIENFDEEQIWQELELQNSALLSHFAQTVSGAVSDKSLKFFDEVEEEEEEEEDDDELDNDEGDEHVNSDEEEENNNGLEEEEEEGEEEEKEHDDEDDEDEGPKQPQGMDEDEAFSGDDSDVDFDVDALEKKAKKQRQKSDRTVSEVDDKFFKLSEMEAFLDDMDRREGKGDAVSEIDYFRDLPSDEEQEMSFDRPAPSKSQKKIKSSRNLKYKDFFDPLDGEPLQKDPEEDELTEDGEGDYDEQDDEDEDFDVEEADQGDAESRQARDALRKVTFDLPEDSEGEDMEEIFGGKSEKASKADAKSAFEKRQEKMAQKIDELEKSALAEKPWQLMGEITGQTRPENSMLEEDVAFDQASRMAPSVTEETTLQLEEIIKQRIKDQVWDDVVRKEKPKEEAFEYKKRLTLDHEKSKLSLAEVYEQEYLKQTQEQTEVEENPAHVEIQKLMDSLFLKLDALSNFHFTPKPAVPEVKIVSNLPSIAMEEVAPVSASDATLLAPEEIKEKNKAGDLLGDSEKTATDKKRERRKKKNLKRLKIQEREKRQKLKVDLKSGGNKTKSEVADTIKKLAKGGKAKILSDDGMDKALRSSQAFFSQLQDQVKSQIKGSKDQTSKKKKKEISASKLKL